MKRRIYRELNITAFILALLVSPAWAATHWVNDDAPSGFYVPPGTSCNNPGYQRIQDAVDAAAAGDVVNVCSGTYLEQVVVATAAKSNLTIRSVSPLQAIIKAPPIMVEPGDLVRMDLAARNVVLRDFVISGPLPDALFCSVELRSGVRVRGRASASILGNRITEIRAANPALRGCQNGFAIAVGGAFQAQTGSATIHRNVLDRYQKGGIYVDNVGSHGDIRSNRIQGEGPVVHIAQNGIQISRGALARVRENSVVDHSYALAPASSASGMILFGLGAGNVVEKNFVARNDDNIAVLESSSLEIEENALVDSTFYDGIYMGADTSNNRIRRNFLRNNSEHDCHDDSLGPNNPPALVANIWSENNGVTENKPGLCRSRDDGDDYDPDDDGDRDE